MLASGRSAEGTAGPAAASRGADGDRVRLLEAVTDSQLAHLGLAELLDELLLRVREIFGVDTAAVLLLDPSGQFLQATAARGLEEEVRQGVRIPLGKGFAGRVAGERTAVAIDQVDDSNVINPLLWEKGIRSMLGVPLVAAGTVLGVLHVGSLTERRFSAGEAELLQLVADRIALATQAGLGRAERAAAQVMQRSLLPGRLPGIDGLEFGARYVPGSGGTVGGDWYDVFVLPTGTVCLVTGDVVGHGLDAALSMGQLRSVLRGHALRTEDPGELLSLMDTYLRHFHGDTMTTVLCAMLDPATGRLRLSSAGHLPPVLARPGRPSELLDVQAELPLGIADDITRRTTTVTLEPGSVLCLYTDGLIERREHTLDVGMELLRAGVEAGHPESVCATVMNRLIGPIVPEDDVALLVVRRPALDALG